MFEVCPPPLTTCNREGGGYMYISIPQMILNVCLNEQYNLFVLLLGMLKLALM